MTDDSDSDPGGDLVELVPRDAMDEQILKGYLDGTSVRQLARRFHISDRAVNAALDRVLPPLDSGLRQRIYRADLARLQALLGFWGKRALEGSASATELTLKILQRRASLTGIDAPINMRLQVIDPGMEQQESSTEALLAELNRIVEERPARGLKLSTGTPCDTEEPPEPEPGCGA